MKMTTLFKKFVGLLVCVALIANYAPLIAAAATPVAQSAVAGIVTDLGTAHSWENMMGTDADGNRYAGRVWVDKSLYKDGDTAILNTRGEAGSSFQVSLEEDEALQVVFSALGSTMTSKSTVTSAGPMDVVLVLDNSDSMSDNSRMQRTIEAANKLLAKLLENNDVRLGITAYAADAATVLPFGTYTNGVELRVNNYNSSGVITAYNSNGQVIDRNYKSNGYALNTNIQAGFDLAMDMLANATNTQGRKPIAILLTDGAANTALDTLFDNDRNGTVRQVYYSNNIDPMIALSTLLSAAYNKAEVEAHYGVVPMVYGVGVDLSNSDGSNAIIDPAKNFNSSNSNANIRSAYQTYTNTWLAGRDVSVTSGTGSGWGGSNYTFRFGHEYPRGSAVTDKEVAAHIHYVDSYYPVASSDLESVFDQIYQELLSGAFNPISSTTTTAGGTGVEHTPLIYVDFIGQHMQIKEIQAVTLFGSSYGVVKNADGTYTVTEATGTNPTTNERWNTAEDIQLTITEQADGTQKLEIRINQEILPIIMEQVVSETVGNVTTSTITELIQEPLRVFYTVGVDSNILLPNGQIDISKLQGYQNIDDANGTVSFYAGQFGKENKPDGNGIVLKGDSHVGFKPSQANRYYYHQANQRIFSAITRTDGEKIEWEDGLYGVIYKAGDYNLTDIDYATYQKYNADYDKPKDSIDHQVYTYVNFNRPTTDKNDPASAAEEVSYLVYTNWSDLRESVTFYDATTKTYLNDGKVIPMDQVAATVDAYKRSNPNAEIYAVLGVNSLRTSRLHNMMVNKEQNITQSAVERYTPEYTYETASDHNGNDVVVWLGNNGVVTLQIDTGIALTKVVTESIGNPDDTYALTVTVPAGVTANPVVLDENGNVVTSTYVGNVLTVNVKAGQTVYISGIPGGTECAIGEVVNGDYYIASKTDTVRIPLVSEALNGAAQFAPATVTNAPYNYGNLFITKEITGDHAVPDSVRNTPFAITVNVGAALAGKTFTVEDSAHSAPYTVTVDNDGNLIFQIKTGQTVEILRLPEGTPVTVTEADPGSHFAVSYRTRNHSGETADADNALIIPADGSATAVVFNRYTPGAVSADLDIAGTKIFTAEGNHPGGSFAYQVQKWNGSAWENISGKTAETSYAAGETGTKTFAIADVLAGITYTEVGNHAYRVIEVKGDVTNVTYDRTVYTFNVAVTDNGGQLVAAVTDRNNTPITDGSYEVTFNNTYHTAPVSLDVKKIVDNKSGDDTVSLAGFRFEAVQTDANWNAMNGAASVSLYSDAAGSARFASVYTQPGTYYFVLAEVAENAPGWTYSAAQYRITVTVAEAGGNLTAALNVVKVNSQNAEEKVVLDAADASKGTVSFVNTYDPQDTSVDLDGNVTKVLTGMPLKADQFTFYVYADGDRTAPVLVGTNKQSGDVHFVDFDKALLFTGVGTYQYDVVEHIPTGATYDAATGKYVLSGMYYDPTIYDLVVEVTNDLATGKLVANYFFEDAVNNQITFRNFYKATSVSYGIGGHKVLHGRAPRDGEFSFQLFEGATLLETVTNKADGTFAFKAIPYTTAGTYTYTVKEVAGSVPGVVYSGANAPITVIVTVTDTNGVLSAKANIANANIAFENTYTPKSAQVTFNGTKTLQGGNLADNAFSFKLYKTDNSFDITKGELLATAQNVNGAFTFNRTLDTTGTYYFVIVEDAADPAENVVYDRTQHKFVVRVGDVGDGQLKAVITNVTTGVSTPVAAAAVTASVAFVNATFEEVTEKEVYLDGNATTQIDGQKVNAGDILTYFITYTNYTGENVVADIVDVIPQYTSYVEGSATRGGSYAGTHINWILNVAKGESVTVSFQVKVEQTEAVVANTAVVYDGVNTYHTNEVVNHTVEAALEKDVFAPVDPDTSIDGQQVSRGDELLYKISFTNASAVATDIQITDVIPVNTTYVAGSADKAGVFAKGAIVWELEDVPAWETVTVTFKVTVNADVGAVTIENKATATDGTNTYETKTVTNHTPEPPAEPTVPSKPTGSTNPQTGDATNLNLWFTALVISCGGFIVAATCGRKKETEEV